MKILQTTNVTAIVPTDQSLPFLNHFLNVVKTSAVCKGLASHHKKAENTEHISPLKMTCHFLTSMNYNQYYQQGELALSLSHLCVFQ